MVVLSPRREFSAGDRRAKVLQRKGGMIPTRQLSVVLCLAAFVAHLVGCGGSGDGTVIPHFVTAFITQATGPAGSVNGLSDLGPPPPAGGPDATVTPTQVTTINGGVFQATLTSPQPFSQIFLWTSVSGVLQSGLWHVTLAAPTNAANLQIDVPALPVATNYEVHYALTDSTGNFGNSAVTFVRLILALDGEVQATVSWDSSADVDLHVTDPALEEVFFGNPTSASGGLLDIDSNANCNGAGDMLENIVWPGTAPAGTYSVRVSLFADCGTASVGTNFSGLVRVRGSNPQVILFQGNFPPGIASSGGSTVAAINYTP